MLSLAVIVPTLNEADEVEGLLASIEAEPFAERIVVDGGSADATLRLAQRNGAVVIEAPRGRGVQLRIGAAAASADVLVFLHADTRLPLRACDSIRSALTDARVVGGCFRLRFDRDHPALAAYSFFTRFDTVFTTFGDQAFFVRADAFRSCGGFPDWPFLEDVELRRRIRRVGRFVKLGAHVTTSARRFRAEGIFRRQMLNVAVLSLHLVGMPASKLTRFYAARSKPPV